MQGKIKRDPYRIAGSTQGKYEIHRLVGIGGMGAVYYAQHTNTKGVVAVKVLKPDLALENPDMIKYFFEEGRKTVALKHPSIIRVTDADITDDGLAYLVMEWLDGPTLEDELKDHGVMSLERVAPLLEQICDAMAHAHLQGIIHRDLKPSNIMLLTDHTGDEAVKILDFGIAKAISSTIGRTNRVMGSAYYASPEQLMGSSSIDHRSDIYSLGVVIYQLLTGKLPFDGDSIGHVINQHISVSPPSLCKIRPEIPAVVEGVVLRALAKKPEDRYQEVIDLARAFRQVTGLNPGVLTIQCLDESTRSSLANASVYLNGKYAGQSDSQGRWQKRELIAKEYLIEIDCHQYLRWRKSVRLTHREEAVITAELTPRESGELIIQTKMAGSGTPIAGAEVTINRNIAGMTDKTGLLHLPDLDPGKVVVAIRHDKSKFKINLGIEIINGRSSNLEIEFPPPTSHRGLLIAGVACLAAIISLLSILLLVPRFWPQPKSNTVPVANANISRPPFDEYKEEDLRLLRERRAAFVLTPSDPAEIIYDFLLAEDHYPKDYRFTYEHAKLSSLVSQSADEVIKVLFQAGEKAIVNGKADEMLNNLTNDKIVDFSALPTGRGEWNLLQAALHKKDKRLLNELNLIGTWAGTQTFDEEGTKTEKKVRLVIKEWDGSTFTGVHFSGEDSQRYEVAISGEVDLSTMKVSLEDTEIIKGDENNWNMGTEQGTISKDGKKMNGEGNAEEKSWKWSYSKQVPK
jgi:serine/threonine protein kinase